MKRIIVLALGLAAGAALVTGCAKRQTAQTSSGGERLTIAVIPKGTTHEFWKSIHAGALKAAQELDVEIVWKGPLREDNRDDQIRIVEDMTNRNVSGIVLAPLDDTSLRAPVSEAKQAGIPTVIIDSALKSDDIVSFVATDNYNGGKLAAEEMNRLLGGKGRIVVLRYAEGSASTMDREKGFLDTIAKFKGIQVLSSNQYGGATTETAYKASENLLAPYKAPDGGLRLDGIYTPNESTTFGMLRALQDNKWAGKVKFVGFDSSEKLIQALEARQLHGLVLQSPMNMGYLGVKTLVAHIKGEAVEPRISTGEMLATPENMKLPEVAERLRPPYQKWLKE